MKCLIQPKNLLKLPYNFFELVQLPFMVSASQVLGYYFRIDHVFMKSVYLKFLLSFWTIVQVNKIHIQNRQLLWGVGMYTLHSHLISICGYVLHSTAFLACIVHEHYNKLDFKGMHVLQHQASGGDINRIQKILKCIKVMLMEIHLICVVVLVLFLFTLSIGNTTG